MSDARPDSPLDLAIAGGGAAGYFAAITCGEARPGSRITIFERTSRPLGKVKISGGGRCNVTHACFDPRDLVTYYPRGARQLIGPFHRWGPAETMDWFERRGVALKVEPDNRVFPVTDRSQTVIDCLESAARDAGVRIRTSVSVARAEPSKDGFHLDLDTGEGISTRRLLVATGGTRQPSGATIAGGFGHRVEPAAPSLFTFRIDDPRLHGLAGLSVETATLRVIDPPSSGRGEANRSKKNALVTTGPVLVTHGGLSGPGILRVSAWGARELAAVDYRFTIEVDWTGGAGPESVLERFTMLREAHPRKGIGNDPQFGIPTRLWKRLVTASGLPAGGENAARWPHLSRDAARRFAGELTAGRFAVDGKSMNKDEFVTCGGVALREVDFQKMESRLVPGLHFAGEVLDIDGITGGFNFQSAWTTGHIAGGAVADSL